MSVVNSFWRVGSSIRWKIRFRLLRSNTQASSVLDSSSWTIDTRLCRVNFWCGTWQNYSTICNANDCIFPAKLLIVSISFYYIFFWHCEFFLARRSLWPRIKRSVLTRFDDSIHQLLFNTTHQFRGHTIISHCYILPQSNFNPVWFMIYDSHRRILFTVKCIIHSNIDTGCQIFFSVSSIYVYEQYFNLLDSLSRQT